MHTHIPSTYIPTEVYWLLISAGGMMLSMRFRILAKRTSRIVSWRMIKLRLCQWWTRLFVVWRRSPLSWMSSFFVLLFGNWLVVWLFSPQGNTCSGRLVSDGGTSRHFSFSSAHSVKPNESPFWETPVLIWHETVNSFLLSTFFSWTALMKLDLMHKYHCWPNWQPN